MVKKLLLFFFIFIGLNAWSQVASPEVHCVSVDEATGNVTITWTPTLDPAGDFLSYLVQASNSAGGPYTDLVVAGGLGTNTYTHNINATLNSWFYRVRTIYQTGGGADTSVALNGTLQTISPQFISTTDSTAEIGWNPVVAGGLPGDASNYEVFRRIGVGNPWQLVGTTPTGIRTITDTFKVCVEQVAFKVELANTSGNCRSVSAVIEDVFEDETAPDVPPVDSVSVDPLTGNLIIGWQASKAGDTRGYQIIYRDLIAQQNILIDSTFGRLNTSYIDMLASGNTAARQYGIAAFDTCETGTPPESNVSSIEGWHRTVFLAVVPDYCGNRNLLRWQHYIGWDSLISHYEVLVSVNGSAFSRIDTVQFPDSTYIHEGVDLTNTYCYIARAVKAGVRITSSSNVACPVAAGTIVPDTHYLVNATVINEKMVSVNVYTDTSIDASMYSLKRAISASGPYFEVNRVPFSGNPKLNMIDSTARTNETDYYYYVDILDSCEFVLASSNRAKTIYLKGDFEKNAYTNEISWTPYFGWDSAGSGVLEYEVYRVLNHQRELTPASVNTPLELYFEEDMTPLIDEGLHVCYVIRAKEANGNVYAFQSESYSNPVCLGDNTNIFVPNAFRPFGYNRTFKPVLAFADYANYNFMIFDRFGKKVFETTNPEQGWDGSHNGSVGGTAVYVWQLSVTNLAGDEIVKRGSVLLLK